MRASSIWLLVATAASVCGSDLVWQVTELVSVSSTDEQANEWSYSVGVSPDGRFVAFSSLASNLVPDDTNGFIDVFVRDRHLGTTERVSLTHVGGEANGASFSPVITSDGRFIAFASGTPILVPGDTNRLTDIFVRDRALGITERVSVSSSGAQANEESRGLGSISADGRFVAFASKANNLVVPNTHGYFSDVYLRDRLLGITERVNVRTPGAQGNDSASQPSMSEDGRYVAFASVASNLVEGITNASTQV